MKNSLPLSADSSLGSQHWQSAEARQACRLLRCGRFSINLTAPKIMAIVNLTPDSFSGDGCGDVVSAALRHAEAQWRAGAEVLDFGAESTRPGASPVSVAEEWRRLAPVLREVCTWSIPVSVDTRHGEVMTQALALGVDMINDIGALTSLDDADLAAIAKHPCALCLMHMQKQPSTMQQAPSYDDVVREVHEFLAQQAARVQAAGVAPDRLLFDPGFGFGKTLSHNLQLLRALSAWRREGWALLAGLSRKTMLGAMIGKPDAPPAQRVVASAAAALLAVDEGAHMVRVHDVAATRDALAVWQALRGITTT